MCEFCLTDALFGKMHAGVENSWRTLELSLSIDRRYAIYTKAGQAQKSQRETWPALHGLWR